jgi:hypothetical protein
MKQQHQTFFGIIILFAIIVFWRGVFGLLDQYFIPNHQAMSLWLSVIVGLVILVVMHYAAK